MSLGVSGFVGILLCRNESGTGASLIFLCESNPPFRIGASVVPVIFRASDRNQVKGERGKKDGPLGRTLDFRSRPVEVISTGKERSFNPDYTDSNPVPLVLKYT